MKNFDDEIPTDYFENLWPLILDYNKCDINGSNECFIPKEKFDDIWAHDLSASNCYGDYDPPVVMGCRDLPDKQPEVEAEEAIEQLPYHGQHSNSILPLDKQLAIIQQDVDTRKKLAHDFANRKFPWYIQQPSYLQDFKITEEMKLLFKDPFEYQILENIQRFQCHVMIIDVAEDVPLQYLERWLKFSPYVVIITVVHDEELFGKLKNFNRASDPILMEENTEDNWQNELNRCLEMGVEKAKELLLIDDASKPIIFVFSHNRGICVCDKFKVLRKS